MHDRYFEVVDVDIEEGGAMEIFNRQDVINKFMRGPDDVLREETIQMFMDTWDYNIKTLPQYECFMELLACKSAEGIDRERLLEALLRNSLRMIRREIRRDVLGIDDLV